MAPFFALFSLFFCSFFFLFQKPFFRNTSREPCRFGVDFGSPRWRLGCLLDASWSLLGTSWILGTSWVPLGCLLVPLGGLLGVPSGLFGVSGGLLGPLGCLLDASWSLLGASWVSVGFSGGSLGTSWVLLGYPLESCTMFFCLNSIFITVCKPVVSLLQVSCNRPKSVTTP